MKRIEYAVDGEAVSDFSARMQARDFLKGREGRDYIKVSSEVFIMWARVYVHDGLISPSEVEILYQGQVIKVDRNGRLDPWPDGFCNQFDQALDRLLGPI